MQTVTLPLEFYLVMALGQENCVSVIGTKYKPALPFLYSQSILEQTSHVAYILESAKFIVIP